MNASSRPDPAEVEAGCLRTADEEEEPLLTDAVEGEPGGIERRAARVEVAAHGLRLDKWLVSVAPEFSRSHLQSLIEAGHVRASGQVLSLASRKVAAGQEIEVTLVPTAQSTAFRPEPMSLSVIHEDEHLLVIDKPAGLVVHPAAGHWGGTLLNGLLAHHAGAAQLPRAGIVHRLDKDTSGLMLVAKSLQAQTALVRAIAGREVRREYLALAHGTVSSELQVIEAPIARDPVSRVRMAVVAGGKPARTDVRGLAVAELQLNGLAGARAPESIRACRISAVHCRLHTGRTHQIRVHLASRGHPLVADSLYGGAPALGMTRQALHAASLSLQHPISGEALEFESSPAPDMASAWLQVTQAV